LDRLLGVAHAEGVRETSATENRLSPRDMPFRFVGLLGFQDPVRPAVPAAVRVCRAAGIRVVMITGDYPATARVIARLAEIDGGSVVTGSEVAALDDAALRQRVRGAAVFARTLPEQKLRIVEALKANGEIVGMTGDGVNDAPSLKAAHIGVAMGGRGTDVAREASSIVLLDDDFGSLVTTVRLGRRIYDNLRKALSYIVALHIPIAGIAVLPLLLGTPLVLTPMLIALIEMIIDPVCSIVLEAEREERDVMDRPPRDPKAPLLSFDLLAWSAGQGVLALVIVGAVLVEASSRGLPDDVVRSLTYVCLVTTNVALIFANRSFDASIRSALARGNPSLWIGLGAIGAVLAVILSWPAAGALFRLGPLHWEGALVCLGAAVALLLVLEAIKPVFRRVPRP
jgi:Ca2+-transporting ATPase